MKEWRIGIASLTNLALAFCFFQHREYLWGIRDYRHVPVNMTITFLLATVPTVVVLLLIPLIARGRATHRWIGMALLILPAYFALAGWMQLLMVAITPFFRDTHIP